MSLSPFKARLLRASTAPFEDSPEARDGAAKRSWGATTQRTGGSRVEAI